MSKHLDIDGFDVVIRVPVRLCNSLNYDKQTPAQAEQAANAIQAAVRRHLGHDHARDWESVIVRRDAKFVCESCGADWTEKSDTYNGGCCTSDEEDHEEEIRNTTRFGVGA